MYRFIRNAKRGGERRGPIQSEAPGHARGGRHEILRFLQDSAFASHSAPFMIHFLGQEHAPAAQAQELPQAQSQAALTGEAVCARGQSLQLRTRKQWAAQRARW